MELIESGYIGGTDAPFSLLDTGETYPSFAEAGVAIEALTSGMLLGTSSGNQGDNSAYASVPSIWKGTIDTAPDSAQIALTPDLGIGFAVNAFNGAYGQITAGSTFPTSAYARIDAPDMGALYIAAKPNASDVPGSYTRYTHEDGVRYRMIWTGHNDGWFLFSNFGGCYFVLNNPGKFGFLAPGSRLYNQISDLKALTLYELRAVVSTASGVVVDPSGQPAPNCRVIAFSRETDRLAGRATTDHEGRYEMFLNAYPGELIYMVCLDNDDGTDFEAQVIDRITV